MCLLVFAWKAHADYPLIVAANRDEFHSRPAQPARWWPDQADLLAGRDLQAGGTWLAVSRNGRFATVTNYREAQKPRPDLRSRGEIVTGFVAGEASAGDFVGSFDGDRYAGVSVLVLGAAMADVLLSDVRAIETDSVLEPQNRRSERAHHARYAQKRGSGLECDSNGPTCGDRVG